VDLAGVARESVAAARPAAEAKGITLDFETDGPAPLHADGARLGQVVDNLVSNAIKFTPDGGRVSVHVALTDGDTVLEVRDSGIGIDPAEQRFLFDRFFRTAEANERAIPGTGLGLTVSKALVEAHGGSISVTSAAGQGTTFRVALPLTGAGAVGRAVALAS
jgi:signal transduction histidine kinase